MIGFGAFTAWQYDRRNGQIIFPRKVQIALIARRRAENRARSIGRQDKIGSPNRDFPFLVKGMTNLDAQINAALGRFLNLFLCLARPATVIGKRVNRRIFVAERSDNVMIRCQGKEACAKQRVGSCGKDLNALSSKSLNVFGFDEGKDNPRAA